MLNKSNSGALVQACPDLAHGTIGLNHLGRIEQRFLDAHERASQALAVHHERHRFTARGIRDAAFSERRKIGSSIARVRRLDGDHEVPSVRTVRTSTSVVLERVSAGRPRSHRAESSSKTVSPVHIASNRERRDHEATDAKPAFTDHSPSHVIGVSPVATRVSRPVLQFGWHQSHPLDRAHVVLPRLAR